MRFSFEVAATLPLVPWNSPAEREGDTPGESHGDTAVRSGLLAYEREL
jgi:hypothetical protein